MSLVRVLFAGLILSGIVTGTTKAEENRDTVHWMLTGVPPKFIPEGPLRGTGYGEQQVALLTKRLPQFKHKVELVTPARLWHEMQAGQGVCSIDIAKVPDRESWALFTKRRTSIPSYRVIVLQSRLAEFAPFRLADGTLDLDRLAAADRLSGIYVASRHYTPQINGFIESVSRKIPLESTAASTKIFEMIASRRGDFSFSTVTEMNYFNALKAATKGGKTWPPLVMMAIKGSGEQVHGHIACSRDALGSKVMESLDQLFEDDAAWNEFLGPERHWLADVPLAPAP